MKTFIVVAPLAALAAASIAQAARTWTPGTWHTIAPYDAEYQLLARALASNANYDSDVSKRMCFSRIFALQEHVIDASAGGGREYSYYVGACEVSTGLGQCPSSMSMRGTNCGNYDISVFVDPATNAVRVQNVMVHFDAGGRGTPPSLVPTTRPPSSNEATPTTPPVTASATTTTPVPTTAGPLPAPTTMAPTSTPTPTETETETTATATDASATSAIEDSSSSRGGVGEPDETTAVVPTTTAPSTTTTTTVPTPTKSAASSVATGVALVVTVLTAALL